MIQNTILAQYYTVLHNYCLEAGFPSPPPPMDEVTTIWQRDFQPIQLEAENLTVIARGKAVHQPFSSEDSPGRKNSATSGLSSIRNGLSARRGSNQAIQSAGATSPSGPARALRIPSSGSSAVSPVTSYSRSPDSQRTDYFQNGNAPIAKKKPPPPPPKRLGSENALYAVALYDFGGQGEGDLEFREGDRIRVVRKTDSTADWWVGELRGVKGNFPANYCRLA